MEASQLVAEWEISKLEISLIGGCLPLFFVNSLPGF